MNTSIILYCMLPICIVFLQKSDPIKLDYKLYYKAKAIDTSIVYIEESYYKEGTKYASANLINSEYPIHGESQDEKGNWKLSYLPSNLYRLYLNTSDNYLESHHSIMLLSDNFYDMYAIEDTITDLEWEITQESKVVGEFKCYLARTTFRCREYFAWFTPEIPYNTGPWKLHGLPGLIIEAYDKNKIRHYKLYKFTPNYSNTNLIDKVLNGKVEKRITIQKLSEFYTKVEKALDSKNSIGKLNSDCIDCPQKVKSKYKIWTWECY